MTNRLRPATIACAFLMAFLRPAAGQEPPDATEQEETPQVTMEELATAPPAGPVAIQFSRADRPPAAGLGRMTLAIAGNRRWCTFPDDRVIQQPERDRQGRPTQTTRDKVYTFGYQFTIAAIERSHPAETLMLFESPVFRTAVMRPAGKIGRGTPKSSTGGPAIGSRSETVEVQLGHESPSTLVPFWQEQYRCTTVPEAFDFDLAPGTYDVYMAFDLLLKSGSWTHRSIGFATDIPVKDAQVTPVDGRVEILAGGRRTVDILGVAPSAEPRATAAP
ncbi:MAG TPA: hypothetical protein VMQ62_13220 [Dongiaceae bacterium]|nr:hypothetical protein [Dongiaceae bacterium]